MTSNREEPIPTVAEVQAFLAAPLPAGQARTMSCRVCGAVTYIRFTTDDAGSGDPLKHVQYHQARGDIGG